ncbi:hypothetical protein SUDANB171_01582 [Streptomyces sp. enrichment culture]
MWLPCENWLIRADNAFGLQRSESRLRKNPDRRGRDLVHLPHPGDDTDRFLAQLLVLARRGGTQVGTECLLRGRVRQRRVRRNRRHTADRLLQRLAGALHRLADDLGVALEVVGILLEAGHPLPQHGRRLAFPLQRSHVVGDRRAHQGDRPGSVLERVPPLDQSVRVRAGQERGELFVRRALQVLELHRRPFPFPTPAKCIPGQDTYRPQRQLNRLLPCVSERQSSGGTSIPEDSASIRLNSTVVPDGETLQDWDQPQAVGTATWVWSGPARYSAPEPRPARPTSTTSPPGFRPCWPRQPHGTRPPLARCARTSAKSGTTSPPISRRVSGQRERGRRAGRAGIRRGQ